MSKTNKRTAKLEVRLLEAELQSIRNRFGRKAAAVARDFLLGYRVASPSSPNRKQCLMVLRSLLLYHHTVLLLRAATRKALGDAAKPLLASETELFNNLTQQWSREFLETNKEE